jgi:hypothetical protein
MFGISKEMHLDGNAALISETMTVKIGVDSPRIPPPVCSKQVNLDVSSELFEQHMDFTNSNSHASFQKLELQ